jgi:hypothetical protein
VFYLEIGKKKLVTCPRPQKITFGKKIAYREGESLAKLLLDKTHEEVGSKRVHKMGSPISQKSYNVVKC